MRCTYLSIVRQHPESTRCVCIRASRPRRRRKRMMNKWNKGWPLARHRSRRKVRMTDKQNHVHRMLILNTQLFIRNTDERQKHHSMFQFDLTPIYFYYSRYLVRISIWGDGTSHTRYTHAFMYAMCLAESMHLNETSMCVSVCTWERGRDIKEGKQWHYEYAIWWTVAQYVCLSAYISNGYWRRRAFASIWTKQLCTKTKLDPKKRSKLCAIVSMNGSLIGLSICIYE